MGLLTSITMQFVDGTDAYKANDIISLDIEKNNNELVFKGFMDKKKSIIHLSLSKLTSVNLVNEEEIIEKSKSVVGRAAIGTLLAGPLGAVIGGISGVGTKQKKGKGKVILTIEHLSGELVFIADKHISITDFYNRLSKYLPTRGVKDGEHIRL